MGKFKGEVGQGSSDVFPGSAASAPLPSGSLKSVSKSGRACGGEPGWKREPDALLGGGDPDNCTQVPGGGAQELQGVIKPVLHRIINSPCSLLLLRVPWTSNLTGIAVLPFKAKSS